MQTSEEGVVVVVVEVAVVVTKVNKINTYVPMLVVKLHKNDLYHRSS